jgi:hypothetical protein
MSDLHIPTPCHESWDGMSPTENGRHCATCNHVVIDIASMPVAEGRRVLKEVTTTLAKSSRRTCVRAHATPAGRLVPGRRKLLTGALASMLACAIAGCSGDGPDLVQPQPKPARPTTEQQMPMGVVTAPKPSDEALKGDICVAPPMGMIVTKPVKGNPPVHPPLMGAPVPRPMPPADGLVVGTVHVDDAPRTPGEPEVIKGKVVAPTTK